MLLSGKGKRIIVAKGRRRDPPARTGPGFRRPYDEK
jgi:hypothetical protein